MRGLEEYLIGIVLAHFAAVLVHAAVHLALGIVPAPLDAVFIVGVITVGPVAAIPVLRVRRLGGTTLLLVLLAASFVYGFASHFVSAGPDNVAPAPSEPWTIVFVATGIVLGVLELAGAAIALLAFRAARTPSGLAAPRV